MKTLDEQDLQDLALLLRAIKGADRPGLGETLHCHAVLDLDRNITPIAIAKRLLPKLQS